MSEQDETALLAVAAEAARAAANAPADPEGAAILAAKHVASEGLHATLTERMAALGRAPLVVEQKDEIQVDVPSTTGTITRYEAYRLPRGNVVVELPSKAVEASFDSFELARTHAHQLNEWLAHHPAPDARYRLFVPPPEPTEAALVETVDRLFDREQVEARAMEPVHALVSELRPTARRTDRKAREARSRTRTRAAVIPGEEGSHASEENSPTA